METLTETEVKKLTNTLNLVTELRRQIERKDETIESLKTENSQLEEHLDKLMDYPVTFDLLIPKELRTIRYMDAIKKIMGNIRYVPIGELEAMAERYDHGCEAELPELEFIN